MLRFFTSEKNIVAALSLSTNGNMKFRDTEEDAETQKNQKVFLEGLGVAYEDFHYAHVVHGTDVHEVKRDDVGRMRGVDALITKEKNVYIGITVADCFPVYFYDARNHVCGVVHAGWRGVVKEIIPRTIKEMIALGAEAESLVIEIGPGISQANFEFHYAEMIQEFGQYSQDKYIKPGSSLNKINIDLQAILLDQIGATGVPVANVVYCSECTFADEKFFSARRHQGDSHSAMLAMIGMSS